jgi:hypothetical protein
MHQILKRRKMKRLISLLLLLSISTIGVFASANYHPPKVPVLKTEFVFNPTQDPFVISEYSVLGVPAFSIDRSYGYSIEKVFLNANFYGFNDQESFSISSINDQFLKFLIDSNRSIYRSNNSFSWTTDLTNQILTGDNLKFLFANCTSEYGLKINTLVNSVINPQSCGLQDNTGYQKLLFRSCQAKSFKLFR